MRKRKKMGIGLAIILVLICITGIIFIYASPQFGQSANNHQKKAYALLANYRKGKFINTEKIEMEISFRSISSMFIKMFQPDPHVNPDKDIAVMHVPVEKIEAQADSLNQVIWLGHSSFLIKLDGKTILLDPVFSKKTGPLDLVGRKKYNSQMPFDLLNLTHVDAVFISHDHYDHLDYNSILQLKDKTDHFFVPIGVGNHLRSWEVNPNKIQEFNWWDEGKLAQIEFAFAPTRHMSGRGFNDQSTTLWGSWILKGSRKSIYFSGDGGYGKHFKAIGEKYGPFDIGLIECGQYDELWEDVHMYPEQSVQAGIDIRAKHLIPIHWGSYRLANHSWTEPVERFISKAKELKVDYFTPRIGENLDLNESDIRTAEWWKN